MPRPKKTESTEKAPKKASVDQKIEKLERVIAKMAHYTGQEAVLREFEIEPWKPGKEDMSRWSKDK